MLRIKIRLHPNTEPVSHNYYHALSGRFYQWLHDQELHDSLSLFSLSGLRALPGPRRPKQGPWLDFPNGAEWTVGAYNRQLLSRVTQGIFLDSLVISGMRVAQVRPESPPDDIAGRERFLVASPVLIKRSDEQGRTTFFLYDDPRSDVLLTETLGRKLRDAGLPEDPELSVAFDRSYAHAKTKLVSVRGVRNRASLCPVLIRGSELSKQFAWAVGVGNSTGVGFGALL